MSNDRKLHWLKQILAVKAVVTLLAWGLPALLGPMSLLEFLGVPTPDDPLFLRLLGAVITAFAVAYWYAGRDPVRNVAILRAGLVDNALVTLAILAFVVFYDLRSIFLIVSAVLTGFFLVAFLLLMPRAEPA